METSAGCEDGVCEHKQMKAEVCDAFSFYSATISRPSKCESNTFLLTFYSIGIEFLGSLLIGDGMCIFLATAVAFRPCLKGKLCVAAGNGGAVG